MPIEVGVWRVGKQLERLPMSPIDTEATLEDALATDLSMLDTKLLLIGRQIVTDLQGRIDLLAIDADGDLVVIELKRAKTAREVVAQLLDYAAWVKTLSYEQIGDLFRDNHSDGAVFERSLEETFGKVPEKVNQRHRLVVVASALDPSSERVLEYLAEDYGVPVNAVLFRHFVDGDRRYLTRTWFIDPMEAAAREDKSGVDRSTEPWNGRDFYVSVGEGEGPDNSRRWEDWQRYGYVAGGGGLWYSQTLRLLKTGSRVFANIPKTGFVGVGEVLEPAASLREFWVTVDGKPMSMLEAPTKAPKRYTDETDPERWEYFVRVKWLKTVGREDAYWEKGFFASQHTACRLRNRFTLERLTKHFGIDE